MIKVLTENYKLPNPQIKRLVGYDIVNYKVESKSKKFILKVYPNKKEEIDFAEAENKILLHLHKIDDDCFPKPVSNSNNKLLTSFIDENNPKKARLLTFLEGEFLGDAEHTEKLFKSFGKFLAKLDLQLKGFRNYVIEAQTKKWE